MTDLACFLTFFIGPECDDGIAGELFSLPEESLRSISTSDFNWLGAEKTCSSSYKSYSSS